MPELEHGGALAAAEARWGRPEAGWLDLSTGINPLPYPVPDLPAEAWTRLPEPQDTARLVETARRHYGAPETAALALAPGTQPLIGLLPRLFSPRRVAILGFTYGEHAHGWHLAGHQVSVVEDAARAAAASDILVVVNPNNPDGRLLPLSTLRSLAESLARRQGLLVLDEAFADVLPGASLCAAAGRPGLLILRSFGKFFGLAGLRLGVALGEPQLIDAIQSVFGPWPVSGPTLVVAEAALTDSAWQTRTLDWLSQAAADLDKLLAANDMSLVGGTSLFRLVETGAAAEIAERLGRNGILVRRFAERPRWLRFGLPPDEAASDRLATSLALARSAAAVEK
jgi:cobalamin biosynthetic protein CobC